MLKTIKIVPKGEKDMKEIQAKQTIVDDSLREIKGHGTEEFPFAVYFDDFSDFENGFIAWHWHEEVQITMILEGDFLCQVESEEIKMKEGDVLFINKGLLHQIHPAKKLQGKLYSFIFRGSFLGGSGSRAYQTSVEPYLNHGLPFLLLQKEKNDRLREKLLAIVDYYKNMPKHYALEIGVRMSQVWMMLCEHMPEKEASENPGKKRDDARIKRALLYMQTHYGEDISLDDIARESYVGRSELCRCFQRILGTSPKEFLLQYRIRQATVLLKKSEYQIAEVAELTGFSSPSHFGSYFKKYMGCTPREYRNERI